MSLSIELVEGSEYRVEQSMDSLPPVTVGLYRAFLAQGKTGLEGLGVYLHLLFTYRLQHTNIIRAEDGYLKDGLKIGDKKLKTAKSLLYKMGLIRYVRKRGAGGRTERWFLELVLQPNPGPRQKAQTAAPISEEPEAAEEITAEEALVEDDQASKKRAGSYQKIYGELFTRLYKKHLHTDAPWSHPKDDKLLKQLYDRVGWKKLADGTRWLFSHPPDTMKSFNFGALFTFFSNAEAGMEAQDRRLRLLKTCKNCGKTTEGTDVDCPKCGQVDAFTPGEGVAHGAK